MKLSIKRISRITIITIFITLLATASGVNAAVNSGWETVGTPGFSAGATAFTSLALTESGQPYVAYRDSANGVKATVMKYKEGVGWENVGSPGFSAGSLYYLSLALSESGQPFVAYQDYSNGDKATVMSYTEGVGWENVGTPGFSAGPAYHTSLALSESGQPFVAFSNSSNGYKATVMSYTEGVGWENVGSPGFSAEAASYTSLALAENGRPYVAYKDGGSGKATVMKYTEGSGWENVGTPAFSAGSVFYPSLALSESGQPFVAYKDADNGYKATVMSYTEGVGWENVGSPGFSAGIADHTSLALSESGQPFVAYQDYSNGYKATVMRYTEGVGWETVGSPGFSAGPAYDTSLALSESGQPFVAFSNSSNGYKATVMVLSIPSVVYGDKTVPAEGSVLSPGIPQLKFEFNLDMVGDGLVNAANNVDNYLLFSDGGDDFQTANCAGGVHANDLQFMVNDVFYDDFDDVGPFIAILTVNNGLYLPPGNYRLLVCGSTSIETTDGYKLNFGADSVLNFSVSAPSSAATVEALPDTGFAPGQITTLPIQPKTKAYADLGELWLEIPKLGLDISIVGVPQVENDWDVKWLGENAGWLEGTAYPTLKGNTVITAHVWDAFNNPGLFVNLKALKHGDQFNIHMGNQIYTYEVRNNYQVYADDMSVMAHSEYDIVTLLTCEGYNITEDRYLYRRVVQAVLVGISR